MGAPGSAWIKSKASSARGLRGGPPPPHPIAVRIGQRFFQRARDRATNRRDTFTVIGGGPERWRLRSDHPDRNEREVPAAQLLATAADGEGLHFRFLGFKRRRYATVLHVLDHAGDRALVVLPEWDPGRSFEIDAQRLGGHRGHIGPVAAEADLGAATPGHLDLAVSAGAIPESVAARCPGPSPAAQQQLRPAPTTTAGAGLVLTGLSHPRPAPEGQRSGFVSGPMPQLDVLPRPFFVADGRRVTAASILRHLAPAPTGWIFVVDDRLDPVQATIELPDGPWWSQPWLWAWWPAGHEAQPGVVRVPERAPTGPYPYQGEAQRCADPPPDPRERRSASMVELAGQRRALSARAEAHRVHALEVADPERAAAQRT